MPTSLPAKRNTVLAKLKTDTFTLRFGHNTPIENELDTLSGWMQNYGASSEFTRNLLQFVANTVPVPLLKTLREANYTVQIKNNIRQHRPELYQDCDYTGGFHERKHTRISVAENILMLPKPSDPDREDWQPNRFWQNAILHELGHALGYILGQQEADKLANSHGGIVTDEQLAYRYWGISESPDIQAAWQADYQALPDSLRKQALGVLNKSKVGYFLMREIKDGVLSDNFAPGRQEVFAEAFDILMRGSASTYNHDTFVQYFPKMLGAVRDTLEKAFGIQLPERHIVP